MKEEILSVNLLRFLAALGVLCVHKLASLIELGYLPNFFSIFVPFAGYGYLGVNLFFLISGFVITLSSEGRTVGQFVSARFIRLFPVFWMCVSITTLFTLFLGSEHISLPQYLTNLTMMPRFYGDYSLIDGSYWTLEVEIRFYFIIAVILLLKAFIDIPLQKIALVLSLPLVYETFFYNPYHISFINNIFEQTLYFFGSEYAQYFIAGILFYGIYKNGKSYYHYIALILCYAVAAIRALDNAYHSDKPEILVLIVTTFFGLFLAISLKKITNTSFSFLGKHYKKLLITLGAVTYPLYLLHSGIIGMLTKTLTKHEISPYIAGPLLFYLIASLVYFVNGFDFDVRATWKQSSVIKNILLRINLPWLKKIF